MKGIKENNKSKRSAAHMLALAKNCAGSMRHKNSRRSKDFRKSWKNDI